MQCDISDDVVVITTHINVGTQEKALILINSIIIELNEILLSLSGFHILHKILGFSFNLFSEFK